MNEDNENNRKDRTEKNLKDFEEFIGDKEDREEYEKNLAERRTNRKVVEVTKRKIRETEAEVKKKARVEELREISRQDYLKKREEEELDLMKINNEDEVDMFGESSRTDLEKKIQQTNADILSAVERRNHAKKTSKTEYYLLPDSYLKEGKLDKERKNKLLETRYMEEEKPIFEQSEWERQQASLSVLDTRKSFKEEKQYDFVFDEGIDFVVGDVVAGSKDKPAVLPEVAKKLSIKEHRRTLPIYKLKEEFLRVVEDNQIVVVVGQTGSGKTTQIPQYLLDELSLFKGKPKYKIGITQPRRVAAMAVASRVSVERSVKLGHEVGFSVRFEDQTSEKTRIKYMTDGMLFREMLTIPDLRGDEGSGYGVIMIDEAHERTVFSDVLLALLKDLLKFRKDDLKVIVASATMDAKKFANYFNNAPIFEIPGRMFPVTIRYTREPEPDYLDAAVVTALHIHITQGPGDILVFLTGQEEIELAQDALQKRLRNLKNKIKELVICPIYANLPQAEQEKAFLPAPKDGRKVVLSTNIAETSLTIDGIKFVIDTGFVKQNSYNPKTGMNSLIVTPISQAQAEQRSGRAGRTQEGACFRLYTRWSYTHELDKATVPEILRSDLTGTVLLLKSLGVDDLINFDFLDPPPANMLIRSLELLYALGALNAQGELTRLGRKMAEFPTEPKLAKSILAAEKYKCVMDVVTITAMLDVNASIFFMPLDKEKRVFVEKSMKDFSIGKGSGGDHMRLANVYKLWEETNFSVNWCYEHYVQERALKRARDIRDQLINLCHRVEIDFDPEEDENERFNAINIKKAILSGYFYHTSQLRRDGSYRTIKGGYNVNLHPSSSLYKAEMMPRWLMYHTLQYTKKEYMRQVATIRPDWLLEVAPHYYKQKELESGAVKKMPKIAVQNPALQKERVTRDGVYY
eukprot:augustus_masked-scaffold_7-processed-gene-6.51-mRNA-1 protein AED:0.03 eAED:0.04 QI:0/-1/0/1/-1/1/1/0/915